MTDIAEEPTGMWNRIKDHFNSGNSKQPKLAFTAWSFVWAVSFLGVTWLLRGDNPPTGAAGWALALVPTVIGAVAVFSFLKFLRQADELMRRIQIEALGIAFGASLLMVFATQNLEQIGVGVSTNTLSVAMVGSWVVGQLIATGRYR